MAMNIARYGGLVLGALGAITGLLQGCASHASPTTDQAEDAPATVGEALTKGSPDLDQVAIEPGPIAIDPGPIDLPCIDSACDPSLAAAVEPSLVVLRSSGHAALLDARFNLNAVLQQLLTQAGTVGETPTELLRRLWDPYNNLTNAHFTESFAPHCGSTLNGYPLDCPRTGDGALANPAQGITPANFVPVALFNRFDLAPLDGSNCGEYRIVYWTQGTPNTGTVIFEAQMPNPHPECGIEACRPIAEFWNGLAGLSEKALGAQLSSFYFNGLPGFQPAIELNNYGLGAKGGSYGTSGGQVRVNTISDGPWQLRENHLALGTNNTKGATQRLFFQPVADSNNPFGDLFNVASSQPNAGSFQSDFPANQVPTLASGDVNLISMSTSGVHNAGQSTSQNGGSTPDDYLQNFSLATGNPFLTAINGAIPTGSGLTAQDMVERATTQSCAGCHQISNGRPLGAGMTWPSSGTPSFGIFVHVGPAGDISEALRCVFLPHRQSVLSGFLQNCGSNPAEIIPAGCGSSGVGKSATLPATTSTGSKSTLGGGSGVN